MIIEDVDSVTTAVLDAAAATPDPRSRQLIEATIRHLHAFLREVQPTEREFEDAMELIARIGQGCTADHNEAVLMSDVLGASTLVCLMNNGQDGATETAAALLGPFWRDNSPVTPDGGSIVRSPTPGAPLFARCVVNGAGRKPLAGARVDVWQASPKGMYENQDADQADMNLRGRFTTNADGSFSFVSVKPAGYPVPTDGPAGDLLRAQLRHPFRPAHVHFLILAPGHKTLATQVFVDEDEYLESDAVFGVTRSLVGDYQRHEGPAPDGRPGEWYSFDYTFHLEAGEPVLPRPPIP